MKKIINTMILSLLTWVFASCTANYININSNPYEPSPEELGWDDYALGAAMNNLAGCVVSPDVNTAQFTDCLLGGPLGGYFADSKTDWKNTISNYNPTDDWTNVFLSSDKVIPVLYTNFAAIKTVSEQTKNPIPLAIAKVVRVAAMHRVTDAYGPIPYSQIGADGAITTPYDSQEQVYDAFFDELDEAIATLTENQNGALVASADYVYGGNVKNWIKFANSLKLRLAIRIAYANLDKARMMAESAIKNEVGVITSNDENAVWDYFVSNQNPIYVATRYNTPNHTNDGAACPTGGDTHAAADIICYMNGYNDSRRAKYFVGSEWPGTDYVGLRRGITIPPINTIGHKFSGVNITPTSPLFWMNAAEVAFLRAEGKAVFGFDMGGDAGAFYNQGIRLSFEQWQVDGADDYMMNESSTPEVYRDPSGSNNYNTNLSGITIKWKENATPEEKQERIIIQKWIANWMIGNEAWADYRRTGYPHLIPATDEGNKSNGIVDSAKGARRIPYPRDEYVSNGVNIQAAVSKYLHGLDNMAQNVWWDCKGI